MRLACDARRSENGDVLVIYSDGYSEITGFEEDSIEDEPFVKVLRQHLHLAAAEMVRAVERDMAHDLDRHQLDDRTMVVVKVV